VGFAWTLPQVAGLLLAGVLSDRFERRRLLILADLIRFLAIGTIAALAYAEVTELWHLMVLVVFYGLGQALFQGALGALTFLFLFIPGVRDPERQPLFS
jgi:MFS family permease